MNTIYYTYILECNDGTRYYGHTNSLKYRLTDHSKGYVASTKNKLPVRLAYYEQYSSRSEAFRREMQLKNGNTRKETINGLIAAFPKANCQGFNSRSDLRRVVNTLLRKSRAH